MEGFALHSRIDMCSETMVVFKSTAHASENFWIVILVREMTNSKLESPLVWAPET